MNLTLRDLPMNQINQSLRRVLLTDNCFNEFEQTVRNRKEREFIVDYFRTPMQLRTILLKKAISENFRYTLRR